MKPIVLTHHLLNGTWTRPEPILITWDGHAMPQELHEVKPGQYVLLPYEAPPEEPPTESHLVA